MAQTQQARGGSGGRRGGGRAAGDPGTVWWSVPYVFFLYHYPRLGVEEAGSLETPMGRPKHPTRTVSLAKGPGEDLPAGQEPDRPNCPIQPDPSLPSSKDMGWGSLASHSLWAVMTPSPFPPSRQRRVRENRRRAWTSTPPGGTQAPAPSPLRVSQEATTQQCQWRPGNLDMHPRPAAMRQRLPSPTEGRERKPAEAEVQVRLRSL